MALEITGKLHEIFDEQQITPTFSKREFVVEMTDHSPSGMTYTNYANFQLVNTSCAIMNNFKVGDEVKVSFNIRGNRWEKDGNVRYITNLNAWRVERVQNEVYNDLPPQEMAAPAQQPMSDSPFGNTPPMGGNPTPPSPDVEDDLPF